MKTRRGFSLMETLIASAILASGLLALAGALGAARSARQAADRRQTAAVAAQDEIWRSPDALARHGH